MLEISVNLMELSSPPSFSSSEGVENLPSCASSSCHGRSFGFRLLPKSPRSKLYSPKRMKTKGITSPQPTWMQSSQKTPNGLVEENPGEVCRCVAAFSADCAAICCCPLVVLHLFVLVVFRLPAAIAIKLTARLKKIKANENHSISKEIARASCNLASPWAEYFTEEIGYPPALGFQDEEFLREYFDCKQLGFGGMS